MARGWRRSVGAAEGVSVTWARRRPERGRWRRKDGEVLIELRGERSRAAGWVCGAIAGMYETDLSSFCMRAAADRRTGRGFTSNGASGCCQTVANCAPISPRQWRALRGSTPPTSSTPRSSFSAIRVRRHLRRIFRFRWVSFARRRRKDFTQRALRPGVLLHVHTAHDWRLLLDEENVRRHRSVRAG